MRILIIGSGGREHALAWKLNQSLRKPVIFIAPGNGGTAMEGENVPVNESDIPAIMAFIAKKNIDFVIPGPELPLVNGIVDECRKAGVTCFGPVAAAAALEGSKAFAKKIMREAGVPTADFSVFTDYQEALAHVRQKNGPVVVKADGLAAGKGVVVAKDASEAALALEAMMKDGCFGQAGATVVMEDVLVGEEASFLAFCQGNTVLPLPSAQDHKAVLDGDLGPNTGGMGAYSPAPVLPEECWQEVVDTIIRPVLAKMEERGAPFTGILYAGLMITAQGPKVVEFNVRFGDPECQPLLMRLQGDLLEIMLACAEGRLHEAKLNNSEETAVCVVVAAKGYPGEYPKGMAIEGLESAEAVNPGKVKVFQAGTRVEEGMIRSSGGRILGVTALGSDLDEARKLAYAAVDEIHMEHSHFRTDIGSKGLIHRARG